MNEKTVFFILVLTSLCWAYDLELKTGPKNFTDANSLELMKQKLFISYAVNCEPKNLAPWTCYWCKFIKDKIEMKTYLIDSRTDTFGFIGETEKNIVIAFRGTRLKSIKNWISNLRFGIKKDFPNVSGAKIHAGFYDDYKKLHKTVLEALKNLPKHKKILFVGHSRGGALASVGALMVARDGYGDRVELMTFGKPRIGNKEFAKYFDQTVKSKWRVVNKKDIVARLPPTFLLKYHHGTREVWFPKNNEQFIICSPTNGEDMKCSHSVLIPNGFDDHVEYLGVKIRDGIPYGCD
eukprot:gene11720-5059_t